MSCNSSVVSHEANMRRGRKEEGVRTGKTTLQDCYRGKRVMQEDLAGRAASMAGGTGWTHYKSRCFNQDVLNKAGPKRRTL